MSLASGTRLTSYEILSPIGAGGMGEVYRARDSRLGREVAIKVLPDAFTKDTERLARFEREARLLASLNHPNIGSIYGLEESVGTRFLVLELVPGETLEDIIASDRAATVRERTGRRGEWGSGRAGDYLHGADAAVGTATGRERRGSLDIDDALKICRQIAEALEAAHEKGIIHRDLKPANVKVTPEGKVKVLDFGLAKAFAPDESSPSLSMSPTLTAASVQSGVILGTAAYMSPEQARGKSLDKRSDIWSFGCVLYECLTGRQPFSGETVSDKIAKILEREADFTALPHDTPIIIQQLLHRCLQKDRNVRLHDIADARIEIDEALKASSLPLTPSPALPLSPSPAPALQKTRERVAWGVTAISVLVAAVALFAYFHRLPDEAARAVRFIIPPPEKANFTGTMAISPDGRRLAFVSTSEGRSLLWIRSLDSITARPLPGTEDAFLPFWSPDSRFIGFFAAGKLKKIEVNGGPAQTLCDISLDGRGGTWNQDGVIVFSPDFQKELYKISSAGGLATPLTKLDSSRQEISHRFPYFLPDGRHFVYLARCTVPENSGLYIGSLESKETKRVLAAESSAAYAAGNLLFVRRRTLIAQPFDVAKLQITGESFPAAEDVARFGENGPTGYAAFSASANGVLAYWGGGALDTQLTWFDRAGKQLASVGAPGAYSDLALSPDEKRLAVDLDDPKTVNVDLWLLELSRGIVSRFTFHPSPDVWPVWSPDGSRIVFASNRDGVFNLFQRLSSAAANEERLLKSDTNQLPDDWSSDGRFIVFESIAPKTNTDLWVLPLAEPQSSGSKQLIVGKPFVFLQTEFSEAHAQISPDGRWIAYTSDESERAEVYVRTFPAPGGKWQISANGGDQPRWRRDGKELFYIAADKRLMTAEVKASSTFEAGVPKGLFEMRFPSGLGDTRNHYVVTADGQRFLINTVLGPITETPVTVVLNWTAGLKR